MILDRIFFLGESKNDDGDKVGIWSIRYPDILLSPTGESQIKPKMDFDQQQEEDIPETTVVVEKKKRSVKKPKAEHKESDVEVTPVKRKTSVQKKRKRPSSPPPEEEEEEAPEEDAEVAEEHHEDEEEEEEDEDEDEDDEDDEDGSSKKRKASKKRAAAKAKPLPDHLKIRPPGDRRPVRTENSKRAMYEKMYNMNEKGEYYAPTDPKYDSLSKLIKSYKKKGFKGVEYKQDPKYLAAAERFDAVNEKWRADIKAWAAKFPELAKWASDVRLYRRKTTLVAKKAARAAKDRQFEEMERRLKQFESGSIPSSSTALVPRSSTKERAVSSKKASVNDQVSYYQIEQLLAMRAGVMARVEDYFADWMLGRN